MTQQAIATLFNRIGFQPPHPFITTVKEGDPEHTGVMVAFMLPAETAQAMHDAAASGLPEGAEQLPPKELHLTLAYLGDKADIENYKLNIIQALKDFAESKYEPIKGKYSGVGRFLASPGSDAKDVLYASFDSPKLAWFHQQLLAALRFDGGVVPASDHGFTPHTTLFYFSPNAPMPDVRVPILEVEFSGITLAWGGEHTFFPFKIARPAQAQGQSNTTALVKYLKSTKAKTVGLPTLDEHTETTKGVGDVIRRIIGNLGRDGRGRFAAVSAGGSSYPSTSRSRKAGKGKAAPRIKAGKKTNTAGRKKTSGSSTRTKTTAKPKPPKDAQPGVEREFEKFGKLTTKPRTPQAAIKDYEKLGKNLNDVEKMVKKGKTPNGQELTEQETKALRALAERTKRRQEEVKTEIDKLLTVSNKELTLAEYITEKAVTPIVGNLGRSSTGQFAAVGSEDSAASQQQQQQESKPKKAGEKKPKKDPKEAGKEAEEKAREEQKYALLEGAIGGDALEGLTFAEMNPDEPLNAEFEKDLINRGLITKDPDTGEYIVTPEAKALMKAAERGDEKGVELAKRKAERMARRREVLAKKKADKESERQKKKDEADKKKAEAEAKKKGGGGGGSGGSGGGAGAGAGKVAGRQMLTPEQKRAADKQWKAAEKKKVKEATLRDTLGKSDLARSLVAFSESGDAGEAKLGSQQQTELINRGLAERDRRGNLRLTSQGQSLIRASERGDKAEARNVLSRAQDAVDAKAEADREKAEAKRIAQEQGAKASTAAFTQRRIAQMLRRQRTTGKEVVTVQTVKAAGGVTPPGYKKVGERASERCGNCSHIYDPEAGTGYCEAYRLKVSLKAWCKSWKAQSGQRNTAKEVGAAMAETLKHGTHNQKSHGRRHLGGRVKDAIGRGIGKTEARKLVAFQVLNDPKSTREERTAARRVIPRSELPKLAPTTARTRATGKVAKDGDGDKPKKVRVTTPKPKPKSSPKAATTKAFGSDPNRQYEFKHRVVDLDELITSNNDNGTINPAYTQELQPRLREREASKRQIEKIAKTFVPESALWDFHQLDKGPAIIGPDNMVESGNGRTLAMRKMRDDYPDKWKEYQQKLKESLEAAGLSETDLKGIKNPVLVRERVSEVDRAAFAKEANSPPVLQMSALEQALVDSKMVSDESLLRLEVNDEQTIDQALRSPRNRQFVAGFVGMLSEAERAPLMRGDGSLSQQGLWRIKAAVFTKLFPGESGTRLADTFLESLDGNIKNFESGISSSMPKLARAESLIAGGRRSENLSISEDLSKAIDMLARLKENGPAVKDYLAQSSMFEKELTPFQESLLSYFDDIGRSPKKIREFMQGYADAVLEAPDPAQGNLFGFDDGPTKESIVMRLIGRSVNEPALATMKARGRGQLRKVAPLKKKGKIPPADSLAAALTWTNTAPRETFDDIIMGRVDATKKEVQGQVETSTSEADSANATLTVYKEAQTGRYRWVLRSGTAFEDRDGQIISLKALEAAVAHMDATGDYGPLRWWHVTATSHPDIGLDLGRCDFSMLVGTTLVESGTFHDNRVGQALMTACQERGLPLEASLGLKHSVSEPDPAGVFHKVFIFERSLLPAGVASNRFTGFAMTPEIGKVA